MNPRPRPRRAPRRANPARLSLKRRPSNTAGPCLRIRSRSILPVAALAVATLAAVGIVILVGHGTKHGPAPAGTVQPSDRPPAARSGAQPPLCAPGTQAEAVVPAAGAATWQLSGCFGSTFAAGIGADRSEAGIEQFFVPGAYTSAEQGDIGTVLAVDTKGTVQWHTSLSYPAISAPVPVDRPGTDPLLVVASYFGALTALDSGTGQIVWELQRPLNTYTPALIDDMDGDGLEDLLVSEGGDQFKAAGEARPNGSLLTIASASGTVLSTLELPEGEETYAPPLVVDGPAGEVVVIGTGGEADPGGLYLVPLAAVRRGDWSASVELARSSGDFGWIGIASLVDDDGPEPIIVANDMGGWVAAFDVSGSIRWERQLDSADRVPRFDLAEATRVVKPVEQAQQAGLALDGPSSYAGPVAADLDCNGSDEVVVSRIRGSLTETVDRTYAVLDGRTGAIGAEFSTSGGGHAMPLVARPAGAGCEQAIVYLGPDRQAAFWNGTDPTPRLLAARASASVTPFLSGDSSPPLLVSVGCEGAAPAEPQATRASGVVGNLPAALTICATELELEPGSTVRTPGFGGIGGPPRHVASGPTGT